MTDLIPAFITQDQSRAQEMTILWQRFNQRWLDRNDRMDRIERVVRGDWTVFAPDDETLDPKSPNLIQVALKDTAESAASYQPTVRVLPSGTSQAKKAAAAKMEQIGASYMDRSEWPILSVKTMLNLLAYGISAWVVTIDPEAGPKIEWRDPRTCFPEPDFSSLAVTGKCFFARGLYYTQMNERWQQIFLEHCAVNGVDIKYFVDQQVTLLEYYDGKSVVVAATYDANRVPINGVVHLNRTEVDSIAVILEEYEHGYGLCPVVIGQSIELDPEPRGQYDQVISVLQAHFDLMALVIDYADQSVYSDVWVKDLIGEMSFGGAGYIQLGPQGQIGRVPPAVSSLSLFNEMQSLMDHVHLGSRWPKSRLGEIDQAIASAKFIESTVGIMNQVVATLHKIVKRATEQALRICFRVDKLCGPERTVAGVLRNQQFLMERKLDDIDLAARVTVDYGLGLGRDNAQTMVLAIQGMQTGMFSKEFAQENFDGITDLEKERRRLDVEQLRDMAFAQLLQGLQEKTIPAAALPTIAKARMDGEELFELFEKYIVKPAEEQAAQMIPSALSGGMMAPGAPPAAGGGGVAPTPPSGGDLMALLGGAVGREEPQMVARNSIPLGNGSFAGVESG